MCKITEINLEVADRSRQSFDNEVIKLTFNPHTTTKKTTLRSHYSDSASGWKYQGIVIVFRGETRGVPLCDSQFSPL